MDSKYTIHNWLGDIDFISPIRDTGAKLPGKRFRDAVFARFMLRVPVATSELQKLASGVTLDHSQQSLKDLDEWLEPFLSEYFDKHRTEIPYYQMPRLNERGFLRLITVFNGLDAFLISIITDCYIYLGECIQARVDGLSWQVCEGKAGRWEQVCFPDLVGERLGFKINYGILANVLFFVAEFGRDGRQDRSLFHPDGITFLRMYSQALSSARVAHSV
jgi:hypothetical protein